MKRKKIIVIGAGMGGLAAAADLARQGYEVTVLERAAKAGGKMRQLFVDGQPIDAGPTVFTMSWVFEGLFRDAGERFEEHLPLEPANILARHRWAQNGRFEQGLDLYADIDQSIDAITAFAGAKEGVGYRVFCARSQDIYNTLCQPFIANQRPNPISLTMRVGLQNLDALWRTAPHQTMWSALQQHFKDPRLQQLFGRYATYCGSSPFAAPATLMLVAHVEQAGVWRVNGGMAQVALALQGLAERQGAVFEFDCDVADIIMTSGRVSGVRLRDDRTIECDGIVFNGDISALGTGLLGEAIRGAATPVRTPNRSQSALTWCVRAKTSGMAMAHHNVFFSNDYAAEFDAVFQSQILPTSPTVYICAQDRGDECKANQSLERLLVLTNAPAIGDTQTLSQDQIAIAQEAAWTTLSRCGLDVEVSHMQFTGPADFEAMFPASGGALYGRANHGMMASFARPGARSRIRGLYLAGGSAHPGPGIPMATISGRLAAAAAVQDLS